MAPLARRSRAAVLAAVLFGGLIPTLSFSGPNEEVSAGGAGESASGALSPADLALAAGAFFNSAVPDLGALRLLPALGDPSDPRMGPLKDVVQLAAKALVNEKEPAAGFSQRELLERTAKLHALEHVFRPYLDSKSRQIDGVLRTYARYHSRLDARHLATMNRWAAVLNPTVKDSVAVAGVSSASARKKAIALRPAGLNATDAFNEKKIGLAAKFIPIKPGEFQMGSPWYQEGHHSEEVLHTVTLTRGFGMQATPVTQLQYFLVMGSNPSKFKAREDSDGDFETISGQELNADHPVEMVSWNDAQEFIKRLNQMQSKYTYRLPTEAEWEYAAKAGAPTSYPYSFPYNGAHDLDVHAWYRGNSDRTHAVAGKRANPWGLYDMNGNVEEWVQDLNGGPYPKGSVTDPTGPDTGSRHILRGGSWRTDAQYLRSADRSLVGAPGLGYSSVGFRLVRTPR